MKMAPRKRKKSTDSLDKVVAKKTRPVAAERQPPGSAAVRERQGKAQCGSSSLIGPHEAAIAKLERKYDILAVAVISSSQIRKRVNIVAHHLAAAPNPAAEEKSALVLLHARPAEVCKLITIVEQCKRVLWEEGKPWYQYNQLFELPPPKQKSDTVEETVLVGRDDQEEEADSSEDDDAFEPVESRLDKALQPPQPRRALKSMRVYLSCSPVQELKIESDVTIQWSGQTTKAPKQDTS